MIWPRRFTLDPPQPTDDGGPGRARADRRAARAARVAGRRGGRRRRARCSATGGCGWSPSSSLCRWHRCWSSADVWDEPRLIDFRDSPLRSAERCSPSPWRSPALTACFRRWPQAFAVAAFAALPLRVPIEVGDRDGEPAGPALPGDRGGRRRRAARSPSIARASARSDGWSRWLERLLAATLVLYAVQAGYSDDVSNAIENLGFFLVPFAGLYALLREVRWTKALLGAVLIAVGVVATLCAAVAIAQWLAGDLFLNPELLDANQLHVYFRVNSIFFDPNILGRYLALALTALGAYLAWSEDRRGLAAALAACAIGLAGLALSFSISSFAALLAGLGVVALLRWSWRGAAAAAGLGLVGLVALLIAGGAPGSDIQTDRGIDSGRGDLIAGGVELAEDRPLAATDRARSESRFVREEDRGGAHRRLPLGADHGGRRAGCDRLARLRGLSSSARWSRCSAAEPGRQRAGRRSRRASSRSSSTASATRASRSIRPPGRCSGSASPSDAIRPRPRRPSSG